MGLRFRKSINFGPLRVNLSKSGVGYSVGVKGARVTKKATGGTRTTLSVPGTGLSHVTETSGQSAEKNKKKDVDTMAKKKGLSTGAFVGLGLAGVIAGVTSLGGGDTAPPPAQQADKPVIPYISTEQEERPNWQEALPDNVEVPEPEPVPEPVPVPEPEPEPVPEPVPEPEPVAPPPAPVVQPDPEPEPIVEPEPTGQSYVGNKNSFVLHESWCSSVDKMKDKNKVYFATKDEALALGYDPCDRCKPK